MAGTVAPCILVIIFSVGSEIYPEKGLKPK